MLPRVLNGNLMVMTHVDGKHHAAFATIEVDMQSSKFDHRTDASQTVMEYGPYGCRTASSILDTKCVTLGGSGDGDDDDGVGV